MRDYPDAFRDWYFISSIGSYISAFGLLKFFVMMAEAFAPSASLPTIPGSEWVPPR